MKFPLPVVPDLAFAGLFALGLLAALALFLSLKRELRRQARKDRARMDELATRIADAERPAPVPGPGVAGPNPAEQSPADQAVGEPVFEPAPLRSGMNMSRRVQAVRLLRRGEDVSHVAAALGVTRSEVELLVRVQKLSAQRAAAGASR